MDMTALVQAALLGLLEGATEFIPVSSTGHLLLAGHFMGFVSPTRTFEILIQFGAILAIVSVYFGRLWGIAKALPHSADARRFVIGVVIAFVPAAIVGVLFGSFIKSVLFNPLIVCVTLIMGGFVLIVIDRVSLPVRHTDATAFPLLTYLKIGAIQCLAMIPGVSRSGATIVGAMLLGADKRSAAEFSFFLAMPTMAGAFTWDLIKNYQNIGGEMGVQIVIGFVCAFISGLFVVRSLLDYVSRHGYALFGWWRIAVGALGLAGLLVFG